MTLSALIKKGGFTGRMTATAATLEADNPPTVATVAVAETSEPPPEPSLDDESNIQTWLAHIEETDPAVIAEVFGKYRNDLDAHRYFLKRSEEVSKPTIDNQSVHVAGSRSGGSSWRFRPGG